MLRARINIIWVSEDGYLLVLYQDKTTICLYTHMPVTDFPEEERGKTDGWHLVFFYGGSI